MIEITYDTYHQFLEKRFWMERNPLRTPEQESQLNKLIKSLQQYELATGKIKPET